MRAPSWHTVEVALARRVAYIRAAWLFALLTVIGAIGTAVFYSTQHTQRGLAALIATILAAVVAVACSVVAARSPRPRRY